MFFERVKEDLQDLDKVSVQLHKLRIPFPLALSEQHMKQIDTWVTYAFARKVRSLELDVSPYSDPRYVPYRGSILPTFRTEIDLSFLRSLSLSGLRGSTEDVASFLLKRPFLEHLKVCGTVDLVSIEISDSSPSLKHLELIECAPIHVTLRGTCLVSLTLTTLTSIMKLVLENNSKLVSVSISHWYNGEPSELQMLSSCLSRLHILTFYIGYNNHDEDFDRVPQLILLKQLTLVVPPWFKKAHSRLITMLNLSPNLEKLVLDLETLRFEGKVEHMKSSKVPLQQLTTIAISGYCGETYENELFMYLLEHVEAPINTIILNPHTFRGELIYVENWKVESVERRVEMLKMVIPLSVKLIIV